ncbi:MAG: aminotransferase class V-fold PLP-dependent enzyme [Chloroflexota bacterium]|nr:aminotransferase class V-fold PLP-dependent enzyme [Chloroflexota bacterium]
MDMSIFDAMGTKAVINARGTYSMLGGSVFSPRVWAAMEAAARSYVDMEDLLDASGQVMATLLSTEAALATPGVAAALALASAALVTEGDGAKLERLPDVSGMKADVLIQRRHRYRYDRTLRLSGARLVDVGDEDGTTADQLAAALGPRTAALCVPAHLDGEPGTVSLTDAIVIAHRRGVPVLVDAAYLVYPIERLLGLAQSGADIICFSAKYMGGPNAGGVVCGRKTWVNAISRAGFTSFELGQHRVFGRPYKLDRHTVVGVVVALQEWLGMDHMARHHGYECKVRSMIRTLGGVSGIELTPCRFPMEETPIPQPINCLQVRITPVTGTNAHDLSARLSGLNPAIALHVRHDALLAVVETLADGEEEIVAARIRDLLVPQYG